VIGMWMAQDRKLDDAVLDMLGKNGEEGGIRGRETGSCIEESFPVAVVDQNRIACSDVDEVYIERFGCVPDDGGRCGD
jgi:hypothetical protein